MLACSRPAASGKYLVAKSNERSGDVRSLDPATGAVRQTIAVGERPRGIHADPRTGLLYVALSGSPIGGSPKLDANGNPVFEKDEDDDDDADAHGIGVVHVRKGVFVKKISAPDWIRNSSRSTRRARSSSRPMKMYRR